MKSFADWTQDLAESIGPVEHHWETRKEADLRGLQDYDEEWQAIGPNWQNPGAPIQVPANPPMVAMKYGDCLRCGARNVYLFGHQYTSGGATYEFCRDCVDELTPP